MSYLNGVGLILVQTFAGLVLGILVLRVVLPLSGARFRNPICQLLYRLTNPVLVPLGKFIPNWRSVSMPGVVVSWVAACVFAGLILSLMGLAPNAFSILLFGTSTLLHFIVSLYFWAILIFAVMSFFSPDYDNPVVELTHVLVTPVLRPFRRLPPHLAGIDLSPLWACLFLKLLQYSLFYLGLRTVLT